MKGMLALILIVGIAGCKAEETEIDDPAETQETTAEAWEETDTEEREEKEKSSLSELLDGEWALTVCGIPEEVPDMILKIDMEDKLLTLTRNSTQEAIMGQFAVTDSNEEAPSGLLKISFFHSSPANQSVSIETDMYLRMADLDGRSVLTLREGGGDSTFMAEQFLKYERQTDDGVWAFVRMNDE